MIADSAARERALDISTSFIVQAPAGSGKTELLIQRYLKLLAVVEAPDNVVAITFTRKAAGEMRARVLDALRRAAAGLRPESDHEQVTSEIARDVLAQDERLGWRLLQNPAQMRMETIDALCAAITRRMPWLARFGAMPEFSEKAEDLYREAARNTLQHLEHNDKALAYLLLHLDNDFQAAERLIVQMLEKRDQWLRLTGGQQDFELVRTHLEGSLRRLILTELELLQNSMPGGVAVEIAAIRRMERFPEAALDDLELWKSVGELLLTNNGDWRKAFNKTVGFLPNDPMKRRAEQLIARLQPEDELREALRRVRGLPGPHFSDSQWQAMEAAVAVLMLAVGELQLVFRERGRVDFAELAIRASHALGGAGSPADLALALGHRIQHILVDEFQDTSYTQFELLEKLTAGWDPGDGRTLFLVGDPMQSIYRFRQADVSLFLRARLEGIGSIKLEPLALSVNFRSQQSLVEWINQTFEKLLPDTDDLESGAVAFAASTAASQQFSPGKNIQVHSFLEMSQEADRLVELVRSAADSRTAVLVRSRAHLVEIVSALKRNRIPFQAIEIDQLGERPVIEDLMALTLALLHPGDRVSWLAVLRAPWCGLTLADLHSLAGSDNSIAVWDLLHREPLQVSDDGAQRLRRILPVLEDAIAQRGRRPLRDWVEAVWLRLGGPSCAEDETALEDASAYFDLLEGLADGADLSDFDWFREQVNTLFAQPDTQASDRLQLMTIHKAKGLEFDTVILPGLGSMPRQDDPALLLWVEHRGELLLAPISQSGQNRDPIYHYLSRIERQRAIHETSRLLYVAITRARRCVHLMSTVRVKDDGSIADPPNGSFLKLLWSMLGPSFMSASSDGALNKEKAPRIIRRTSLDWSVPAPPPSIESARHDIQVSETPEITFRWVGDTLRYAGTALHAILQRVVREGIAAWDEQAVRARRPLYVAVLRNLGVSADHLADAAQHVETALLRMLRDARGRWVLEPHSEDECELAVTGMIDGKLYEAVIDRTFVDEMGVRWIIDYKTSTHEGRDLDTFLENEKERYAWQLERYARLLFQQDGRPIRCALYYPLLGGWREWPAAVVARKQMTLFEF